MQFSTIWGEVLTNFPTSSQARCKTWANVAYHEVVGWRQWSWRESSATAIALAAGVNRFTLTGTTPLIPDFGGMISVNLQRSTGGGWEELWEMKPQLFDQVMGKSLVNGCPAVWAVQGGTPATTAATIVSGGQTQLVIGPPPIATTTNGVSIQLRYFRNVALTEMVLDTDQPLCPTPLHGAIILGANSYMASSLGNAQKAAMWRQMYMDRIKEAVSEDEGMRLRSPRMLVEAPPTSVYPITGQTPATFDPATRPYDR